MEVPFMQWLWAHPVTAASYCALLVVLYYLCAAVDSVVLQPYQRHRLLQRQGIRGPRFIPFVGNAALRKSYAARHRVVDLGVDLRKQFGPVAQYTLGPYNVVHLSDPHYIAAAWKTQRSSYQKSALAKARLAGILGNDSILLVDEKRSAVHRKMIGQAFHFTALKSMYSIIHDKTIDAINSAVQPSSASSSAVELHRFFTRLAFSIITACAFGNSLQTMPDAADIIARSLNTAMRHTQLRSHSTVDVWPVVRSLPICGKPELDRAVAELHRVVLQMVQDRKDGRSKSQCDGMDLLDILLTAKDPETGEGFSPDLVRQEAVTFIIGGHETTSSLMAFTLRDLLARPQLYALCRAEVERVTGGGPLQSQNLADLTLIDAVLHESFRLHPPGFLVSLEAVESHYLTPADASKKPLYIPRGTLLFGDIYVLQRAPELWGDTADSYDEQRWIKSSPSYTKPPHPIAFNGFSVGTRNCIGQNLAMMEARTILALVVRHLDIDALIRDGRSAHEDDRITHHLAIEPTGGVWATVRRAASTPVAVQI